jgi:hypothetical protein
MCKRIFQVKYSNTSGLSRHLKSKHNEVTAIGESQTNCTQNAIYFDSNSVRAQKLTEAIARMIALDLQPYSIVEDVGFRSLLNITEPRYIIPSRSTFARNIVPRMYENLRIDIMNKIHTDIAEGN